MIASLLFLTMLTIIIGERTDEVIGIKPEFQQQMNFHMGNLLEQLVQLRMEIDELKRDMKDCKKSISSEAVDHTVMNGKSYYSM